MDIVTATSLPRVDAIGVTSSEVHTITDWPPSTTVALAGIAKEAAEKKEEHNYHLDRPLLCEIHLPSPSVIITGVALFRMLRLGPGVVRASMTVNSSSPSTMLSSTPDSVVHASALSAEPSPKVRGIKSIEKSPAVAEMCICMLD